MVGSCKLINENLDSIKCGYSDYLRNCQLLKKDSALWSYVS
jgi:hypothetical protein